MSNVRSPLYPYERAWDEHAKTVRSHAAAFAALVPAERASLLRECAKGVAREASEWVRLACVSKGVDPESPTAGEEWLGGPAVVVRMCRLLAESWEKFGDGGLPHDELPISKRSNGLVDITVFPTGGFDKALFGGFTATVECEPLTPQSGPSPVPRGGRTCLVLGAGNVTSIPAMDALGKMFIEGRTCVLKMNPVNACVGPCIERAFAPLVSRGFLRVAYGDAAAGHFLCHHDAIDEVHITGSDATHDKIVWGGTRSLQALRRAANDPALRKPITSELGNVSPVIVTPGEYRADELAFMARNVAAMVANNASCNCNAAKMLVTSAAWPQRREFLAAVYRALAKVPTRKAYYPGADERYRALTDRTDGVSFLGGRDGTQPWALVSGLDPAADDPLFRTEPFCAILSEVALPGDPSPGAFLPLATDFCNQKLWGTLNASVLIDPRTAESGEGAFALDHAVNVLNYGTVAVNHWPALGYGFVSPPWGAAPGHTLADVGSGIGWVHNTYMLRGVRKSVIRGPLVAKPKPAWFADNKMARVIGEKLVRFELEPSAMKLPGIIAAALRG